MIRRLRILSVGACCTIQDRGRIGYLRDGVSNSGPMDWVSYQVALKLAGARAGGPAIEASVGGIEIEAVGGDIRLGLAGGGFSSRIGTMSIPHPAAVLLEAGSRLSIRSGRWGAWFYVAPAGGMDLAQVMGSASTLVRYGIGPQPSRILREEDEIPLLGDVPVKGIVTAELSHISSRTPIRVVLGPQNDRFSPYDVDQFLSSEFTVSPRNDRMAYMLEGPRIQPESGYDIITDATALGSIQAAGDGSLFVLMADRPSTGGYPKIATVIRADIGRLAQRRLGEPIRFEAVSLDDAVAALRDIRRRIVDLRMQGGFGAPDLDALNQGSATGIYDALRHHRAPPKMH